MIYRLLRLRHWLWALTAVVSFAAALISESPWLVSALAFYLPPIFGMLITDILASVTPECRAAITLAKTSHPDWDVWVDSASIRERNPAGSVVAVYFQEKGVRVKPSRHVIVRLDAAMNLIEMFDDEPDSIYAIKGRK